jgi:hypothetical protein
MRPPVDDSATAMVSPLCLRRAATELARVWSWVGGMVDDFLRWAPGVVRRLGRASHFSYPNPSIRKGTDYCSAMRFPVLYEDGNFSLLELNSESLVFEGRLGSVELACYLLLVGDCRVVQGRSSV